MNQYCNEIHMYLFFIVMFSYQVLILNTLSVLLQCLSDVFLVIIYAASSYKMQFVEV